MLRSKFLKLEKGAIVNRFFYLKELKNVMFSKVLEIFVLQIKLKIIEYLTL